MALTKTKAKKHLASAFVTFGIYSNLQEENEQGWGSVMLFYTCLNLCHAVWEERRLNGFAPIPEGHPTRSYWVSRDFAPIYGFYENLHDISQDCRYETKMLTFEQLERLYQNEYLSIVDFLSTLPEFTDEVLPTMDTIE